MSDSVNKESCPMTEETLRAFINRREKELVSQIAALRGQLEPREKELAELRSFRALQTIAGGALVTRSDLGALGRDYGLTHLLPPPKPYEEMTIGELAIQALSDGFPGGAATTRIREFIKDAYGREIAADSLRTQLHRMMSEGTVRQAGSGRDLWIRSADAGRTIAHGPAGEPTGIETVVLSAMSGGVPMTETQIQLAAHSSKHLIGEASLRSALDRLRAKGIVSVAGDRWQIVREGAPSADQPQRARVRLYGSATKPTTVADAEETQQASRARGLYRQPKKE
jgi:hypothetical protein